MNKGNTMNKTTIENRWIELPKMGGRFFERQSRVVIDGEIKTDWTRMCVETKAEMLLAKAVA